MIGLEAAVIRWPPLCVPYCISRAGVCRGKGASHAHPPAFRRPETLAAASRRSSRLGRADEHRTDQEADAQDRGTTTMTLPSERLYTPRRRGADAIPRPNAAAAPSGHLIWINGLGLPISWPVRMNWNDLRIALLLSGTLTVIFALLLSSM